VPPHWSQFVIYIPLEATAPPVTAPAHVGHVTTAPCQVVTSWTLCRKPTSLEHILGMHNRGGLCAGRIGVIEAEIAFARGTETI
jgi:hypothetical protein